jgi:hypothetical protein
MINFAILQEYLDKLVVKANDDTNNSPHKRFWSDYQTFITKPIPLVKCNGAPIFPIAWRDAAHTQTDADNSPLYLILTQSAGFCNKDQMPPGPPFITDQGYTITLSNGSVVTGKQIADDIHEWITSGALENPAMSGGV